MSGTSAHAGSRVSVGPHMPTSPSSRHGSKHERAFTDDSIDDRVGNILPNRIDHNHDHTSCAKVAMQLVYAGDVAAFERYMSQLSRSQVDEVYSIKNSIGHEDGGPSVAVIAVKRGDLKLIESVLKWIPKEKFHSVLMAKNESDGRTVMMIAAAADIPEVLEAFFSRLTQAQMREHLAMRCARGNSILVYAVRSGRSAPIETLMKLFSGDEVSDALGVKNFLGETPLMHAARAREPGAVRSIANMLPKKKVAAQLEMKTEEGQTALAIASKAGNVSTWRAVASRMSSEAINRQLTSTDVYGEAAVMWSIRSGSKDVFVSVVGRLTDDQVKIQLATRNELGQTPMHVAVAGDAEAVLTAMLRPKWISSCMLNAPDESETQLTALDLAVRSPVNLNITRCLLACGATPTARVVLKLVRNGAGCGRLAATRDCFLGAMAASEWATNPLIPGVNISVALMEAKRQSADFRSALSDLQVEVDSFVLSILRHLPDTVSGFDHLSALNVRVETTIASGARRATALSSLKSAVKGRATSGDKSRGDSVAGEGHPREGRTRVASSIARGVSMMRLRCAEKAVTPGMGITFVQEMLEPELAGLQPRNCAGPLALAVQSRHLEFICSPLVVNYLRLKFSAGLPNPFRETDWRREHGRSDRDLARFMLDTNESKLRVYILQGGGADSPSWTYLPGLQFILAGVAGKTAAFFGVPAMRLALDVLIYMCVIAVFVLKVVVLQDAGKITSWEFLWLVYVLGAIWQQWREVQEAGSIRVHFFNPWNIVEATTLATLTVAFLFRTWAFVCDGHGEWLCGEHSANDSDVSDLNELYLAQYFQAASAPFVLGKMLFLTQIHSSLGPLMHSTFRMFTDLARFGALMLVILFGFALAFYAMFGSRSATLPDGSGIMAFYTYASSLLTLFASMLGNFDFSDFDGAPMGQAGVVLLVFFLCVMNITLLNLLIAILATAHARVERNSDKEAVLSEALIITQYRRAMRIDSLPSPLNVPQELVSHLFWKEKERVKEIFARGVFWLISGPIAIVCTAILWTMSLPLTLAWAGRVLRSSGSSMLVPSFLGISFNLGVAPVFTARLWVQGVVGIWRQGHGTVETSDRTEIEASRAYRRRSIGAGGAGVRKASMASVAKVAIAASTTDLSNRLVHLPRANKSRRWWWNAVASRRNRSGGGGIGQAGDGVRTERGFDVAAAVRAESGLTVLQLKARLESTEEMAQQEQHAALSEALAGVQKGHDRIEAILRTISDDRARMDAKLELLVHSCRNNAEGAAITSRHAQSQAEAPTVAVPSPQASCEKQDGRGVTATGTGEVTSDQDRAREAHRRRRDSGLALDDFIDEYHAGIIK